MFTVQAMDNGQTPLSGYTSVLKLLDIRIPSNDHSSLFLFLCVTVRRALLSYQFRNVRNWLDFKIKLTNFFFKVTVHVTDDNDNAPRFQFNSPYKMTVMEDASMGTTVGRVQAFDSDAGQNAVFEYAITHANIGKVPLFRPCITSKCLQIHC